MRTRWPSWIDTRSESKPNSPEEFATYIAAQNKIWIEVGQAAGVKID
jgi:hypothetical protein